MITFAITNVITTTIMDAFLGQFAVQLPLWILVGILVVWITIHACRFYFRKCHPVITHAQCEAHHTTLTTLQTQGNDIDQRLARVMRSLETIKYILIAQDDQNLDRFSEMHSPRQINVLGEKLLEDSGAKALLEAEKSRLLELLTIEEPHTGLDVEMGAFKLLLEQTTEDWFIPIKRFVYNNPRFEGTAISIATVCLLMGLVLRNAYLEQHPEINVE